MADQPMQERKLAQCWLLWLLVFLSSGSFATTIVLAQTMLPDNVGMAAGLTIGFSVGMGGFGVTILGFIADNFGLPLVMQIVTWLPVAAAIIALKIPIPASLRK